MNHLKKIEDRVISILKTNVDARSDDMMLYALIVKIIRIGFAHDFIEFIVRITGIFFF